MSYHTHRRSDGYETTHGHDEAAGLPHHHTATLYNGERVDWLGPVVVDPFVHSPFLRAEDRARAVPVGDGLELD